MTAGKLTDSDPSGKIPEVWFISEHSHPDNATTY